MFDYLTTITSSTLKGQFSLNFEMLVLDPAKKTRFDNALDLLYALRSFSKLWDNPNGELVFEQTFGLLTREDIANRIMQMPEQVEALKTLKTDLQSNYHKFFKTAFADKDFKAQWKEWESLRNKVAHTNLFTKDDLIKGGKLQSNL